MKKKLFLVISAVMLPLLVSSAQSPQKLTAEDYTRAWKMMDRSLTDNITGHISGSGWISGGRYWFNKRTGSGHKFMTVHAENGTVSELFDHTSVAAQLAELEDKEIDGNDLPFSRLSFSADGDTIMFNDYVLIRKTGKVKKAEEKPDRAGGREAAMMRYYASASISPDGSKTLFIKDYNLWMKDSETGEEVQLTTDGEKDYGYATNNAGWTKNDWHLKEVCGAAWIIRSRCIWYVNFARTELDHPIRQQSRFAVDKVYSVKVQNVSELHFVAKKTVWFSEFDTARIQNYNFVNAKTKTVTGEKVHNDWFTGGLRNCPKSVKI